MYSLFTFLSHTRALLYSFRLLLTFLSYWFPCFHVAVQCGIFIINVLACPTSTRCVAALQTIRMFYCINTHCVQQRPLADIYLSHVIRSNPVFMSLNCKCFLSFKSYFAPCIFIESLLLSTNNCTYITFTQNTLKNT